MNIEKLKRFVDDKQSDINAKHDKIKDLKQQIDDINADIDEMLLKHICECYTGKKMKSVTDGTVHTIYRIISLKRTDWNGADVRFDSYITESDGTKTYYTQNEHFDIYGKMSEHRYIL